MRNVLVVEDDVDLLFLYHTALTQRGFNVIAAQNTTQAMNLLADPDFIPNLVILDMGMPDAPGTRAITYMRNNGRFDDTQIVVVTANEQYRERVAEKGVSHFLVKPVGIADLVNLVDQLTD